MGAAPCARTSRFPVMQLSSLEIRHSLSRPVGTGSQSDPIAAWLVPQQSCEHPEMTGVNCSMWDPLLDISASRKKLLAIFKLLLHLP